MENIESITAVETRELTKLEARIKRGINGFLEVCEALAEISEKRLYRAHFKTFEEYCKKKWGMGRSYAYRLIGAAGVVKNLSTTGNIPTTENVIRPLTKLSPKKQVEVWKSAVDHSKGTPTATDVREAMRSVIAPEKPVYHVSLISRRTTVGELIERATKKKGKLSIRVEGFLITVIKEK